MRRRKFVENSRTRSAHVGSGVATCSGGGDFGDPSPQAGGGGGGGGGGAVEQTSSSSSRAPARHNPFALNDCVFNYFGVITTSFSPSAPGTNGSFTGFGPNAGRQAY